MEVPAEWVPSVVQMAKILGHVIITTASYRRKK